MKTLKKVFLFVLLGLGLGLVNFSSAWFEFTEDLPGGYTLTPSYFVFDKHLQIQNGLYDGNLAFGSVQDSGGLTYNHLVFWKNSKLYKITFFNENLGRQGYLKHFCISQGSSCTNSNYDGLINNFYNGNYGTEFQKIYSFFGTNGDQFRVCFIDENNTYYCLWAGTIYDLGESENYNYSLSGAFENIRGENSPFYVPSGGGGGNIDINYSNQCRYSSGFVYQTYSQGYNENDVCRFGYMDFSGNVSYGSVFGDLDGLLVNSWLSDYLTGYTLFTLSQFYSNNYQIFKSLCYSPGGARSDDCLTYIYNNPYISNYFQQVYNSVGYTVDWYQIIDFCSVSSVSPFDWSGPNGYCESELQGDFNDYYIANPLIYSDSMNQMSHVNPSSGSVLGAFSESGSIISDVLDLPNQLTQLYTNISGIFQKNDDDIKGIIPSYITVIMLCMFGFLFFKKIN